MSSFPLVPSYFLASDIKLPVPPAFLSVVKLYVGACFCCPGLSSFMNCMFVSAAIFPQWGVVIISLSVYTRSLLGLLSLCLPHTWQVFFSFVTFLLCLVISFMMFQQGNIIFHCVFLWMNFFSFVAYAYGARAEIPSPNSTSWRLSYVFFYEFYTFGSPIEIFDPFHIHFCVLCELRVCLW